MEHHHRGGPAIVNMTTGSAVIALSPDASLGSCLAFSRRRRSRVRSRGRCQSSLTGSMLRAGRGDKGVPADPGGVLVAVLFD